MIEYSRAFFPVLIAVLVLRAFLFEPFRIPSGSMMPTLLVGDFILVNKFSYGLRFPVWHNRITEGDKPKRGDVIVFRYPQDETQDYIKRVIGLPGDHVRYYNRRLTINDKPLEIETDRVYQGLGDLNKMQNASGCDRIDAKCQVYIEEIDQSKHTIMTNPTLPLALVEKYSFPKVTTLSWVIIATTVMTAGYGVLCQRKTWSERLLEYGCTGIGARVALDWICPG